MICDGICVNLRDLRAPCDAAMESVSIRVIRGLMRCLRWVNLRYLRDLRATCDAAMASSASICALCGISDA